FSAARHHAWRRWFGVKAAVTRPAQMRGKNACLALEAEDGAINIWLFQKHARVIGQVTSRKIVRPIHDNVILADQFECIVAAQTDVVKNDLGVWIDALDSVASGLRFGPAHIGGAVQNLTLQVGKIHSIEIDNSDLAN